MLDVKEKKNPQKAQDSVKLSEMKKKVHDKIKFDPRPPSLWEPGKNESKRDLLRSLGCNNDSMWNTILCHTYSDFELDFVNRSSERTKKVASDELICS